LPVVGNGTGRLFSDDRPVRVTGGAGGSGCDVGVPATEEVPAMPGRTVLHRSQDRSPPGVR